MRHLQHHAAVHPDRPAVIMAGSGAVTTYAQLDERSNRLAHGFRAAGLDVGDHVALMMENRAEFIEVAWAAQRAGLYYTALNSHLRRDEAQHILDDCGARAFVTTIALHDVAAQLDLGRIELCILVDDDDPDTPVPEPFVDYEWLLANHPPAPLPDQTEGREMLYSSGTTGVPKGVLKVLSGGDPGDPTCAPVVIAEGIAAMGLVDGAVYLSPAPLYHSAPLVYSMACHRLGATAVVMESFDAETCLAAIERYGVTHAQFVPTMFTRMLRLPESMRSAYDLSSLRLVLHAAAPCPVPTKQAMMDWFGPIIVEYYAGTEDLGSTFIGPEEWLAHPGSVGRPMVEMHIVGADGEEAPVGEPGTVYFAGGRDFEYHNDPEKTADVANERGWRTLGDVGYVDADGYLYLTDRAADMVVSGGVNIYPREAEDVLGTHPAVLDVAVFGIPDDEMGEAVKAVVQFADDAAPVAEADLLAYCREHLATYKCPRSVDVVDAMPRDPSGKLFKRRLREPYWAGRDSRVV